MLLLASTALCACSGSAQDAGSQIPDAGSGGGASDASTHEAAATADSSSDAPSCHIPATCADLVAERTALVQLFRTTAANEDYDALPALGACIAAIVAAELEQPSQCRISNCERICSFHDCPVYEGELPCVDRCIAQTHAFTPQQIEAITLAAAKIPICGCDICTPETFAFCTTVWDCRRG
jgi:hypothetical protein